MSRFPFPLYSLIPVLSSNQSNKKEGSQPNGE